MGVKDALNILRDYKMDRASENQVGGYPIKPVNTPKGLAVLSNELNDYTSQMQEGWRKEQSFKSKPDGQDTLGITQQYQAPTPSYADQIPQSISDYATGYRYSPGGDFGQSRLSEQNLGVLWGEINNRYPDLDQGSKETLLANLVAVAQAESGMGGAYGNPEASNYKNSNFWNWFKGGDRGYDPQNFSDMAADIVPGIGGYTLGSGGKFTRDNASTYTGNDKLSFWYDQIYGPAMNSMGY